LRTRPLGRTGLTVPVVSFGGIPCNRVSEAEGVAAVRHSFDLGYRLFDTSRTYGDSERRIGLGLGRNRSQVVLATKLGPWKVQTPADAERCVHESLEALGTDYLDILMIKNLDNEANYRLGMEVALPAIKAAREAGRVGHLGLTSHVPAFGMRALESGEFAVAMLPYSIANRSHEPLLDYCAAHGIGVLAMKPLAGGALVEQGEREAASIAECLRFCLSHPAVATAVVGIASGYQAQVAWTAGEQAKPLSPEEREALIARAESLGEDYCRGCEYCQPCTAGIEIHAILQAADRLRRFASDVALRDATRSRYAALPVRADACRNCKECLPRCPFNLPITDRLAEAHALLGE